MGYDVVVVGAGFAGSVIAERLATQARKRVLVLDRRDHVGGNTYDELDDAGLLVHRYGPHIFHTNSAEIFEYLSAFTDWRPYEHRVLACVRGMLMPVPINRTTVNRLFGISLSTDAEVERFYRGRAEPTHGRSSEDVVVGAVGRELYELFFRGYTRKQWGLDPSQLDGSVAARVPARTDDDDRYFTDRFQAMPAHGYTRLFERLLAHPKIDVWTGIDFASVRSQLDYGHLVYTGSIDSYFDQRYGPLPYRSLRFEFETLPIERYQPTGTVNYPDETAVSFTRITEFKHLTGQRHSATTIVREYPQAAGDPYYPIPRPENRSLYERYRSLAAADPRVHFVGRLATYKYYNMDQVVGQALATYRKIEDATRWAA
jgi:UDP-galactopyranose mutase